MIGQVRNYSNALSVSIFLFFGSIVTLVLTAPFARASTSSSSSSSSSSISTCDSQILYTARLQNGYRYDPSQRRFETNAGTHVPTSIDSEIGVTIKIWKPYAVSDASLGQWIRLLVDDCSGYGTSAYINVFDTLINDTGGQTVFLLFPEEVRRGEVFNGPNDDFFEFQPTLAGSWTEFFDFIEENGLEGRRTVDIAVIDADIDAHQHSDLSTKFVYTKSFLPGNRRMIDHEDRVFHGSAMSGIIAAETDNETGVAGVCHHSKCRLQGYRAGGRMPTGLVQIIEGKSAMIEAGKRGAEIINLSWGFVADGLAAEISASELCDRPLSRSLWEDGLVDLWEYCVILEWLRLRDVLVVTAAGNHERDLEENGFNVYPAEFGYMPHVLTVGAHDSNDRLLSSSNSGSSIHILAPGDGRGMLTTGLSTVGSGYIGSGNTSMAAAFVSGAAGLVRSEHPEITAIETKELLQASYSMVSGEKILSLSKLLSSFKRGDINSDGKQNHADAVYLLNWYIGEGSAPRCMEAADTNGDGSVEPTSEAIYLLNWLYKSGPAVPSPIFGYGWSSGGNNIGCRIN